jgi:hypothetical protein
MVEMVGNSQQSTWQIALLAIGIYVHGFYMAGRNPYIGARVMLMYDIITEVSAIVDCSASYYILYNECDTADL